MKRTEKMGMSLTTHPYKATNAFGGVVMHVQRARCTAGKLGPATEPARGQQGALSVQGICFVNATLCKPFVLMSLLILTLKRMVSAAEVTSSTHTKYSWLSDKPGAKKRSVNVRTWHARRMSSQLSDATDL